MSKNDSAGADKARDRERALNERPTDRGPAARRAQVRDGDEFAIAGNARERGEDPSPDDRERGETSINDRGPAESDVARTTGSEAPESALGGRTATRSGTAPTPADERAG